MPSEVVYPHIVKDEGSARLARHPRTRISMLVADYLWRGWSAEEIVRHYPHLTLGETHAALGYYFDHREEIESELIKEDDAAEVWRKRNPTPPLLLRLKKLKEESLRDADRILR